MWETEPSQSVKPRYPQHETNRAEAETGEREREREREWRWGEADIGELWEREW